MTRKILAIVLALAMVFALCLTACGGEQAEEKETTKAAEKDTTKAEEKDTTAAGTEEETFELETVDWYDCNDMSTRPDFDEYVWPEVQAYMLENLNIDIQWHGFASSEYYTKLQTTLAVGNGCDLFFLNGSSGGFYVWYERNAMEPLNDLLEAYAPELVANMPDYAFAATTIDGSIYAMPTIKDLCTDIGYYYNATLLEDLGLTEQFEATEFENAKDLEEIFYAAKDARDEMFPDDAKHPVNTIYTTVWAFWKADEIIKGFYAKIPGLDSFEDQADEGVFMPYGTETYNTEVHRIAQWVKDNINPYDAKNYEASDPRKEGKLLGQFEWGLIVSDRNQYAEYGWTQELRHPNYAFTYTIYPQYCMHCINAQTTDSKKVAAMRAYNCLCEDGYVATTMRFGVEDLHWQRYTDENGNTRCTFDFEGGRNADASARNYYMWYFADFGDLNSVFLPDTQGDEFMTSMVAMNDNAVASQYMGFVMSTTNITNELAAVATVVDEYHTDMMYGMIEDIDSRIDEFVATMNANGADTIIADIDAQMTEWKAAQ